MNWLAIAQVVIGAVGAYMAVTSTRFLFRFFFKVTSQAGMKQAECMVDARLDHKLKPILEELAPNDGGSLFDKITRMDKILSRYPCLHDGTAPGEECVICSEVHYSIPT